MPSFDDFADLIRRRLGASRVRPCAGTASPAPDARPLVLTASLPSGESIEVVFDDPTEPAEHLQQELELLLSAFRVTLEPTSPAPEVTPEHRWLALRQLLAGLAARAGALEVVVIDAHSPVVWGAAYADPEALEREAPPLDNVVWLHTPAEPKRTFASERYALGAVLGIRVVETLVVDPSIRTLVSDEVCDRHTVVPLYATQDGLLVASSDPTDVEAAAAIVRLTGMAVEPVLAPEPLVKLVLRWRGGRRAVPRAAEQPNAERERLAEETKSALVGRFAARPALRAVRALPEIPTLRKGGHVHRTLEADGRSVIARSFGGIYVLVVILPARFDEIRAKHTILQALPAIESLVVSLPPRTPRGPLGAAGAMRRRR